MKIILIRHGQTDCNKAGIIQGTLETELNDCGIKQSKRAAEELSAIVQGKVVLYSSTQKRAQQTAGIIADKLGLANICLSDRLVEINLGKWQGMTWADVHSKYPSEIANWKENPWNTSEHGGENYTQVRERAIAAIKDIAATPADYSLIVTHGAVINALEPSNDNKRELLKIENGSIRLFDAEDFLG